MNINTSQCSRNLEAAKYRIVKGIVTYILIIQIILFRSLVFAGDRDTFYLMPVFMDSVIDTPDLALKTVFLSQEETQNYLIELPTYLHKKGFLSASIDSVIWRKDTAVVKLFLGYSYQWVYLLVREVDKQLLEAAGYQEKNYRQTKFSITDVESLRVRVLHKLEDVGYPFASVGLDSIQIEKGFVAARFNIQRGPQYRIDSIRVFGDATISKRFLHRYLQIPPGTFYQQKKLNQISPLIKRLPYLLEEQPWQLNMLGTGSVLDLYLKNKKSSQLNGFLGFLPASDQLGGNRMLLTGDLNVRLINSFGKGEDLMLQFQQIQVKSPRLQITYQHPYVGGSAWGLDLAFDGFRKDSSFLNIRLQAGAQYAFGGNTEGKVFIQQFITTLDFIDTALIRTTKRLPAQLDQRTSFLGIDWKMNTLSENVNPRKGIRVRLTCMGGLRNIRPNNVITSVKNNQEPSFNYAALYDSLKLRDFTFRIQAQAERFVPLGKISVLRASLNAAIVQNKNLFRNELFQIGGLQILRGFDDESIFASYFTVLSLEYRLLTGPSSYLYVFADAGHTQNKLLADQFKTYAGTGFGTAFETKAGMFNVAFAVGGGAGVNMNFRQAKIHLGYINRF